jgi:hypothetical protein
MRHRVDYIIANRLSLHPKGLKVRTKQTVSARRAMAFTRFGG